MKPSHHAKTSSQTCTSDAPSCNPSQEISPLTSEHVSCTAPAARNASLQILFKRPTPAIVFENATKMLTFAHFWQVQKPLRLPQKWSKCSVHLKLWLRNVLFEQLNVQKCYGAEVWTCWLPNVLRNTAACIFWAAQLPKVLRILRNVLRTTAVCNFWSLIRPDLLDISAHRFSEPTFRPSGETNIGKTLCFATFLPFRALGSSF